MTAPAKLPEPSVDYASRYLAERYGPDFRTILGLVDHPYAEQDDSAFWDVFGPLRQFDLRSQPSLTDATSSTREVAWWLLPRPRHPA